MSLLKKFLIDPFTAKTNLSNLASVNLANSSRRFKTSADSMYQEIKTTLSNLKSVDHVIQSRYNASAASLFQEIKGVIEQYENQEFDKNSTPLSQCLRLHHRLHAAIIKTGWEAPALEQKLERVLTYHRCKEEYATSGVTYSLVNHHLLANREDLTLREVQCLHGLCLKMEVLSREWGLARLLSLYGHHDEGFKYAETVFKNRRKKSLKLYNALLYIYAKSSVPKQAEDVFKDMIQKGIRPSDVTFRALIPALGRAFEPSLANAYFSSMWKYGLKPKYFHYGALIDAYARSRSPANIGIAVKILKGVVPMIAQEIAINSILTRCYPSKRIISPYCPTAEEVKEKIIPLAQDLINFLDESGYAYTVLASTHQSLMAFRVIWPKSVSIKPDWHPIMNQKK